MPRNPHETQEKVRKKNCLICSVLVKIPHYSSIKGVQCRARDSIPFITVVLRWYSVQLGIVYPSLQFY